MNYSKDDVCVLIPTLNEKATIEPVIQELQREGYHHILVVDGQSTDGTPEIAEKLGVIVMTQGGIGKGAAMIEAFKTITSPYILMLDGDGTNPPEYADAMIEPLVSGRADHVIGNRLHQYERGASTRLNLWGNRLINILFKWVHGIYMTDILSGYRAFTLDSVRQMNLKEAGFEIETEISSAVIHRGLRFVVIPTFYKKRLSSPTKLHPVRDGYKILRAINKYGKMNNPLFHFSVIGVLISIAGFCLGLYALFEWLTGIEHLFMGILTMHLIIAGIICDMILGYHRELVREMRILRTKLEEIEKKE